MNRVDEFIIYDNIKYTKKGWINRNRILVNGKDQLISLPLKKDSDYLNVDKRFISETFKKDRKKTLSKIYNSYRKAPYFESSYNLMEKIFGFEEFNLFNFIFNSLVELKEFLQIDTELSISSSIEIDHGLQSQEKVLALCKAVKAKTYINPIGGMELYNKRDFDKHEISLQFLKTNNIVYPQLKNDFIPFLSVLDVIMFNNIDDLKHIINNEFELKTNEKI